MLYMIFGAILFFAESARLAGILRDDAPSFLPTAFTFGMPFVFLALGLRKASRSDRLGVLVFGLTILCALNRGRLGLDGWGTGVMYASASLLGVLGVRRIRAPQALDTPVRWFLLGLVVVVFVFAVIVFSVPV